MYGHWGVGESCHESQWVYGVGNIYAYTTSNPCVFGLHESDCATMISSEGPSPTGTRTFFYNNTMLNLQDADWCRNSERTHLNLTQFWGNHIHSPTGTKKGPTCRGGNNTVSIPQPIVDTTTMAGAILAPYPRPALKTDDGVHTVATNITVPHLSGIFVNIDRVADVWTEQQWRADLTAMRAVGIEFFIIHHVARATTQPASAACPLGYFDAYYPTDSTDPSTAG